MTDTLFLDAVKKISDRSLSLTQLIATAEALKAAGSNEHLLQVYNLWIQCNGSDPLLYAAHFNYSALLSAVNQLEAAKQSLEKAIALKADFYPAYINLGSVLERMGKPVEAIAQWTNLVNMLAVITGPSVNYKLAALKQIGRILESRHISPNAESTLKLSLEINPAQKDVVQHYVALRLVQCEWPVIAAWEGVDRKTLMSGIGPLSMAIYAPDPLIQMASAWNYCRNYIGYPDLDKIEYPDFAGYHTRKDRRRIGYVSSDLRNHAVGFIMAELFEVHDRENFEVFVYYCGPASDDAIQKRVKASVDHWLDINEMTDLAVAQRIEEDGIEILVDVNGYTKEARTRLFAMRPAPVIVNWLGYPGTMASPYHHYIIADEWIIPPEHEIYYTEKVLRLPCYQPNDRKRAPSPEGPSRQEANLPEDAIVFCSFNGTQKISRFTYQRWLAILKHVPNSVLWLLEAGDTTRQRLRDYAEQHGVAGDRIIFAEKKHNPDHLARYPLADIFLDSLPYGAHVTASDALWMGVPVITLCGVSFASRVCSSLVSAAGLPELICHTPEEYIERAVTLANDRGQIAELKKRLAANRNSCILFDIASTARHLEELYRQMWHDFCNNELPQPNLTNLETYLEIGIQQDYDASEILSIDHYHATYKAKLASRHRYYPLPADNRLWTEADIEQAASLAPSADKPAKVKRAAAKGSKKLQLIADNA